MAEPGYTGQPYGQAKAQQEALADPSTFALTEEE